MKAARQMKLSANRTIYLDKSKASPVGESAPP
jgi:hypothetical protein